MNYVKYEVNNRIARITLNRPDKRNALNHDVVSELKDAFNRAEKSDDVKIVILNANGEAFCAGADLGYLQDLQRYSYAENLADSSHLKELFHRIYTLNKVVIAQVEGDAIAGGSGLAICCDFVFCTSHVKFGFTEVRIGFIPAIVMVFLLRKINGAHARELLLTGGMVDAVKANKIGIVNKIFESEIIDTEVETFAARMIESNSGNAMMMTKQMIAQVQSLSLDEALTYACEMNAKARASEDCRAGISAFLRKEKIKW